MKKSLFVVAVMIISVSLLLTVGAERAGAQGSRRCRRIHRCKGQFEFIGVEELAFLESHQVGEEERQGFQEFRRFKRQP